MEDGGKLENLEKITLSTILGKLENLFSVGVLQHLYILGGTNFFN